MNSLIKKFAEYYNCNLSLYGSLLVIAANSRQVKIKFFTTLPEQEQRQQLVLARNTLNLIERIKKEIVAPAKEIVAPSEEEISALYDMGNLPPFSVEMDMESGITADIAYH